MHSLRENNALSSAWPFTPKSSGNGKSPPVDMVAPLRTRKFRYLK